MFSFEFCEIFKKTFFTEHLQTMVFVFCNLRFYISLFYYINVIIFHFDQTADISQQVYDFKNNLAINPLSANPTKWSNTLKQFVGKLPTNCFSVFDHCVGLARKVLTHFVPMPFSLQCLSVFSRILETTEMEYWHEMG